VDIVVKAVVNIALSVLIKKLVVSRQETNFVIC